MAQRKEVVESQHLVEEKASLVDDEFAGGIVMALDSYTWLITPFKIFKWYNITLALYIITPFKFI